MTNLAEGSYELRRIELRLGEILKIDFHGEILRAKTNGADSVVLDILVYGQEAENDNGRTNDQTS